MSGYKHVVAGPARWTRWLVIAILFATLAFHIASWFPDQTHIRFHALSRDPLGRIINITHLVFMVLAMIQLILLLREMERGAIFSSGVTRRLRAFALLSLLAIFSGAVLAPLLGLLFPQCEPGGHCLRRFPIDMRALWSLVISLVFFLVARLLDEARRIDEDNQQII